MAQKPVLRAEVYARALCASQNAKTAEVWVGVFMKSIRGPTQLNIHLEGVSDHGDKHDFSFFGTLHVLEAARRQCWHRTEALLAMLAGACGRYSAPNEISFRSDHHSEPTHGTHAADHMLAHALGHS
jgi:hypothetical protein